MGAQVVSGFVDGKTLVGGAGESGIGHGNSIAALDHYGERKAVYVELGEVAACGYRQQR